MNTDIPNSDNKEEIASNTPKETTPTAPHPEVTEVSEANTESIPASATPVISDENYPSINPVFFHEEDADFGLDDDISFDADFSPQAQENTPSDPYSDQSCNVTEAQEPFQQAPVYSQPVYNPYPPESYASPENTPYYSEVGQPYSQPSVQAPDTPSQPETTKKKKSGTTALIICLWVLLGLFAVGFFGLCGYILGISDKEDVTQNNFSHVPTLFSDVIPDTTTPPSSTPPADNGEQSSPDQVIIPLPDIDNELYSDDTSITLNAPPKDSNDSSKYTTQYAYKAVTDSTVGVMCYGEGFSSEPESEGTGIIISKNGYVVTNSHVIGDSKSYYHVRVITTDGTIYEAKVIGYDSRTDIAVLKVNATNLKPAAFCDSQYVEVGQDVIAVGNPGGIAFQNSITRGIVSAIDRELSQGVQVPYIQTDAAINPGNSGGPLCNMYGQVIGINTAKISSTSYEGMGFAIPASKVKDIADDLISVGYVKNRVRLGISGTPVDSATQQFYSLPAGILIKEATPGGPCDGKGIQMNDILTAIDDETVETFYDVYSILEKHKPGDSIVLSIYKTEQKKTVEITVTLAEDKGETQQ